MAKYSVVQSCGHLIEHNLLGPGSEREKRFAWLKTVPCRECEKALETKRAAEWSHDAGLPPLCGSPKMRAWAERIRAERMQDAQQHAIHWLAQWEQRKPSLTAEQNAKAAETARRLDAALGWLKARAESSFWIDNREGSVTDLLRKAPEKSNGG